MKKLFLVLALLALPGMANALETVTLLDEDFTSDFAGWYLDAPEHSTSTTSLTLVDDSAVIGTGNALSLNALMNTDNRRHVITGFDTVELTGVGHSITLTWDFHVTSVGANGSGNKEDLRFGIYNDAGTPLTFDDYSADSLTTDDDPGYFARTSTGSQTEWGICTEMGVDSIAGGPAGGWLEVLADQSMVNGFAAGVAYSGEMTIEYLAGGDLKVSTSVDGILSGDVVVSAADVTTYSFNELAFTEYDDDITFMIDNVLVEATIPEPATLCLLGLGGLLLRKRK